MSRLRTDARAIGAGYVLGSLPFGLALGWAVRGLDVREVGSGSTGSSNVVRAAGPMAGAATFALDAGKGTASVLLARRLGGGAGVQVGAGLAALVGHAWPVFAGFRGGKCVATALGGLLALSPDVSTGAVVGGLGALAATRTVCLGSLSAATSATLFAGASSARGGDRSVLVFAGLASALIAYRHTDNIRRLARGVEPTIGSGRRGD